MKNSGTRECAVVMAAVAIIAGSLGFIVSRGRQRVAIKHSIQEAMDSWEGEGGAVPVDLASDV